MVVENRLISPNSDIGKLPTNAVEIELAISGVKETPNSVNINNGRALIAGSVQECERKFCCIEGLEGQIWNCKSAYDDIRRIFDLTCAVRCVRVDLAIVAFGQELTLTFCGAKRPLQTRGRRLAKPVRGGVV